MGAESQWRAGELRSPKGWFPGVVKRQEAGRRFICVSRPQACPPRGGTGRLARSKSADVPRGAAGWGVGVRTDRRRRRQREEREQEDRRNGVSLPTRSAPGSLGAPAAPRATATARAWARSGSGGPAEAGRLGKEGRTSGAPRARQRAARSRGRRRGAEGC